MGEYTSSAHCLLTTSKGKQYMFVEHTRILSYVRSDILGYKQVKLESDDLEMDFKHI